ncbi:VOC family protein [Kocuria sp.]|jgi:catechol 2,3-dioxygenase-like lactoylglutathione lyase family enzyme|uniref:VOC family protein n=1 Tax=Kocuria sp. TaxID=1871328 RepID=UPI0028123A89|nr:VOC family protein [Kocuria sp.]HST72783.1 VOC family protein [Kocuria rosea]
MTSTVYSVAVDCRDPEALARFWCEALGYVVHGEAEGYVGIAPPEDAAGPRLDFLLVPEPKTVKNRLHLDLRAADGDQAGEVARLESLGARRADVGQGSDVTWVVLADPEGNEFCVLADLEDD